MPVDLQGACSVGAELLGSSIKYVQTEGESYFKCQNSPKCGSGLLNSKAETMPDLEKLEKKQMTTDFIKDTCNPEGFHCWGRP